MTTSKKPIFECKCIRCSVYGLVSSSEEDMPISEIARRIGRTRMAIHNNVVELEKEGYIQKSRKVAGTQFYARLNL